MQRIAVQGFDSRRDIITHVSIFAEEFSFRFGWDVDGNTYEIDYASTFQDCFDTSVWLRSLGWEPHRCISCRTIEGRIVEARIFSGVIHGIKPHIVKIEAED